MFKKSWKGAVLLAATGLTTALASPALAEGDRDRRGDHYRDHRHEHRHVGVLYINGRAYQVNGPGAFHDELYNTFRRAGYRCDFDEGRFRIYVGARRPAISWRGGCGCGTVSFTYSRGYLYVNLGGGFAPKPHYPAHGKPHHDDRRGGGWSGHNSPHYTPRYTPHYKPVPHYQPRVQARVEFPSVQIYSGSGSYYRGSSWGKTHWGNQHRWPSYRYDNRRLYPYGHGTYRRGWDDRCR